MSESNTGASPSASCRYFYADPLAAAWMARHFGMKFDVFSQPSGVRVEKEKGNHKYIAMFGDDYRFYIHPDSLPLLEPQAGDIIFAEQKIITKYGGAWNANSMVFPVPFNKFNVYRNIKIIQRNGKPFHWPESEAA